AGLERLAVFETSALARVVGVLDQLAHGHHRRRVEVVAEDLHQAFEVDAGLVQSRHGVLIYHRHMGIASRIAARVPREFWLRPAAEIWETEHRLMHALGRARPPAAVQWMVTRSCDLHCGHCYAEAGRRAHHELTTDEARELVIDAVADMGCPLLVFAGGELWLRRDIEQLSAHAVARGLEWAMHTHGGHVAKHREFLRRHPPALAAISLDGDAALHDGFRGKPGSHAAALAAVRELVEAGCRE